MSAPQVPPPSSAPAPRPPPPLSAPRPSPRPLPPPAAASTASPGAIYFDPCNGLNAAPGCARQAWTRYRPRGALSGSRAAPGGPGPVCWWCGGVSEALAPVVAAVAGRGARALVLFVLCSISAYVFEVVPRSYLGCPGEYGHDLGCFGHVETMYFRVVTLILHETVRVKSPFPPLVGLVRRATKICQIEFDSACKVAQL